MLPLAKLDALFVMHYVMRMLGGAVADRDTERLHRRLSVRRFKAFERTAFKKLRMLDAAASLEDLKPPPNNRLEKLRGDRSGQWSIRINDQWRICFRWEHGDATGVEIVAYH